MGAAENRVWRRTVPAGDLVEGSLVRVDVASSGGRRRATPVVVARVEGQLHAFEDSCPHAGWPLSDGDYDGRMVSCLRHFWEFDVVTGQSVVPSGWPLRKLPVSVDAEGFVLVDVWKQLYG